MYGYNSLPIPNRENDAELRVVFTAQLRKKEKDENLYGNPGDLSLGPTLYARKEGKRK